MSEKTSYNGSGGHAKASLTIELEVLIYELIEEHKDEFKRFYNEKIRGWLAENRVAYANAWIVGPYLIVVTSQNPPWGPQGEEGGIPGLKRFVKSTNPVPMEGLDKFTLAPGLVTASYPKTKSA